MDATKFIIQEDEALHGTKIKVDRCGRRRMQTPWPA